jgi:hypothetical protein
MNRRQFALNAGSLLGLSMSGVSAFPAHAVASEVAAGARGLYRRALVLQPRSSQALWPAACHSATLISRIKLPGSANSSYFTL